MTLTTPTYGTTGNGEYVAGENHQIITAGPWRAARKRGVIVHGGWGQQTLPIPAPDDVSRAVTAAGIPIGFADFVDGKTFGSDTGRTRVGQMFTFMQSRGGAKTDRALLYGTSGGAPVVLNWARQNPTQTAAIALVIPALDIQDIHDNARGTSLGATPAAIETSYGGAAAYAAAMPAHNPAANTGDFAGIPIKIWASFDDPVCLFTIAQTFATATGAALVNMGNLGHASDPRYSLDVSNFLSKYA